MLDGTLMMEKQPHLKLLCKQNKLQSNKELWSVTSSAGCPNRWLLERPGGAKAC